MPLVKQAAAAEAEAESVFASNNPDEMVQGGLMDDFDGAVIKSRYVPWDYQGNLDHYVLGVALTVQPYDEAGAPDGDPFVQTYSAGELDAFVPGGEDGSPVDLNVEEVGEEQEGTHAIRVGKKTGLNNNTNWAFFLQNLIDANFDKSSMGADVRFMEGVFGHWNRIPQKKRSGIIANADPNKKRRDDILVLTELKELPRPKAAKGAVPGAGGKSAGVTAGKPVGGGPSAKPVSGAGPVKAAQAKTAPAAARPSAPAVAGSIDDRLRVVVGAAVREAGELPKSKLAKLAIDNFTGAEKGRAVKRIGETEFLESGAEYADAPWAYDADSGTLLYAGE